MEESEPSEVGPVKQRWVNLALFVLVAWIAGIGFLSVQPIEQVFMDRFAISAIKVSLLVSLFGITQMIFSIPSGLASGKVGFKKVIGIGSALIALGFVLRPFARGYSTFFLFTLIAAIGWGFILGPVGILVHKWFPEKEVGLAMSLWPVGLVGGLATGALTVAPLLHGVGWEILWLLWGIVALAVSGLWWAIARENPPKPPESRPELDPLSLVEGIGKIMGRNSAILLFGVFMSVGAAVVVPALIPRYLIPQGLSPTLAGLLSGTSLAGGAVGSFVIPSIAMRKNPKTFSILGGIVGMASILILFNSPATMVLPTGIISFTFGFFELPVLALCIGMGTSYKEVTPQNVGSVNGLYLTAIGAGATLLPLITSPLNITTSWLILVVLLIVMIIGLIALKPPSREPS